MNVSALYNARSLFNLYVKTKIHVHVFQFMFLYKRFFGTKRKKETRRTFLFMDRYYGTQKFRLYGEYNGPAQTTTTK